MYKIGYIGNAIIVRMVVDEKNSKNNVSYGIFISLSWL